MKSGRPLVVDIKRNSLDDGPGIRTAVFFKGCPLRCSWCHNPEGLSPDPELAWFKKECMGCGECARVCKNGAAALRASAVEWNRESCRACFDCVEPCPSNARRRAGRYCGIEELARLVTVDRPFYENSGGGVTLTGGEPLMFMEYASDLLKTLKERGIHTLVETCGQFDIGAFIEKILPWTDMLYYDVKIIDPALHHERTGVTNERILDNLEKLAGICRPKILPRIPLIPRMTATESNLLAAAAFLEKLGFKNAVLLHYNPLWHDKADAVGRKAADLPRHFMPVDEVGRLEKAFYDALR